MMTTGPAVSGDTALGRLETLATRARHMWRDDPTTTGSNRTDLLLRLHDVRIHISRLEAEARRGDIWRRDVDSEIQRCWSRLDDLNRQWAA